MSMISEQVRGIKACAYAHEASGDVIYGTSSILYQAADTIESLSAKLQAANMERSEEKFNDDLISKNELLKIIDSRIADYRHDCNSGWQKYADWYEYDIRPLVRDFQSINTASYDCGGWISCKDRLPEDSVDVLVWFEYFRYGEYNKLFQTKGISYTFNGEWSGFINGQSGWNQLRIIAWQPLPEDYHEP